MAKLIKSRSRTVGLPPGTLVHIGEQSTARPALTVIEYDETGFQERELATSEACPPPSGGPAVTWINLDGIHQVEIVEKMGECLGLHPLVLEDILNTDHRPKMEDFGTSIFIILKTLNYDEATSELEPEQISLILDPHSVISFQESGAKALDPIRERIRNGRGRIRRMAADYLLYALLDAVIDNYFVVLEQVGEKVEFLEEQLVTNPTAETLQTIHSLKRDMIFLRKSVWPLREVIGGLERGESALIGEATGMYLRDIYDHTIQVIDTIETFRDMISGMLDIYLSSVSNRMNEVMKVLTIIATIFIPLTLIAGIYGMNFKNMPELNWPWGYPMVWVVMLAVAALFLVYFRRKTWI